MFLYILEWMEITELERRNFFRFQIKIIVKLTDMLYAYAEY